MAYETSKPLAPNVKGEKTHTPQRGYVDQDFELNLDPNQYKACVIRKEDSKWVTYHNVVWRLAQYGYKSKYSLWTADLNGTDVVVTWD